MKAIYLMLCTQSYLLKCLFYGPSSKDGLHKYEKKDVLFHVIKNENNDNKTPPQRLHGNSVKTGLTYLPEIKTVVFKALC